VSWRVAVRHHTGYHYGTTARASYNEVRMTPATTGNQLTLTSRADTTPGAPLLRYVDYWAPSCTPSTCTCRTPSWG
jgi:Bacterial transglutaminase-like N-terminal region